MKNNETGEFELVMGNKQLLSGFFIVVILFAVFFVMGYIVGRNSTPVTAAATRDTGANSTVTGGRPQPASPAAQIPPPESRGDSGNPPAAETPLPAAASETKAVPAVESKPVQAAPAPAAVEPAPGDIYLQVTSVKGQDVAETVAKSLKDKGFPAGIAPGVNGQTRVLVGPYTDRAKLGQTKAELERLGFQPFVKK